MSNSKAKIISTLTIAIIALLGASIFNIDSQLDRTIVATIFATAAVGMLYIAFKKE